MNDGSDIIFKERSKRARNFILSYTSSFGFPPSVREIAEAVGYTGPGQTHRLLDRMVAEGQIERAGEHTARAIRVRPTTPDPPRNRRNELG